MIIFWKKSLSKLNGMVVDVLWSKVSLFEGWGKHGHGAVGAAIPGFLAAGGPHAFIKRLVFGIHSNLNL